MSDHARLSPSGSHRWMKCPGSVREEAKYPPEPSGKCAVDGTHSHTLLEYCINQKMVHADSTIGMTLKDKEGEFVVDSERIGRVNIALSYVDTIRQQYPDLVVIPEEKLDPAHLLGRSDMKGTADIQLVYNRVLEVIDYKDGMKPVDIQNNSQLEIYGIAALSKYKLPLNGVYPIDIVKLTVVQPKMLLKGGEPITSVEYSVSSLMNRIGTYAAAAVATDDPDAPLKAGDHCSWCRHKGACTEVGKTIYTVLDLKGVDVAGILANRDTESLDNAQIVRVLEAESLITGYLEAVRKEAFRRLNNGIPVPGLKLVNGRMSQEWNLKDEEIADRLQRMGVPKDDCYVTKVVSPAQAKKLKWTRKRKGEEEVVTLSDRQIKTLETEYINKKSGNLIVTLDADSRPAVNMDASTLFAPIAVPETKTEETKPELPNWLIPTKS